DRPIHALLIEDNPGDARLIGEMMAEAGNGSSRMKWADRLGTGLQALIEGEIDIVLLDLALPDSQGIDTLSAVRTAAPGVPVVVLTGLDDENAAMESLRQGAQDYLVKGKFDGVLLLRSIRYARERKRIEKTLRESEERFRTKVENSFVGIFIVRNGRIVFRNPEQKRLFGEIPEFFMLREFHDIHPEDRKKFSALCDAIDSGETIKPETDLRFYPYGMGAEGVEMRWVLIRTSPIRYEGQGAVLVNMVDITRSKEVEHNAMIREKMAVLGHAISGIAHEIRNPLSGINIHLSVLEKLHQQADGLGEEEREEAKRITDDIKSASFRIEDVIKKVMDFSKPSAFRLKRADINTAVEEAIDFSLGMLRKRGITLDRSGIGKLPKCMADRRLFTQVLLNLITNAAEAMENSEKEKVLAVSISQEGGRAVIRVADSGPGVPPHLREKVFDPFFTTRQDGYGIGLNFSRRVIAGHRGSIKIGESRWGGAEFRIELPIPKEEGPG
ncbi:MAG TPA: ATP-binding protein, partial [Patescibacteria group bacterium]|nr:ATP-binding protein [Patescibacteria group bacterium]